MMGPGPDVMMQSLNPMRHGLFRGERVPRGALSERECRREVGSFCRSLPNQPMAGRRPLPARLLKALVTGDRATRGSNQFLSPAALAARPFVIKEI